MRRDRDDDREIREALREIGHSEDEIDAFLEDADEAPLGRDARDYEDEYPHGWSDD